MFDPEIEILTSMILKSELPLLWELLFLLGLEICIILESLEWDPYDCFTFKILLLS